MSNRKRLKRPPPQNPVSAFIAALDGARIPGGCGTCDAYQIIQANISGPNVHAVRVYHDDDCPELAARESAR